MSGLTLVELLMALIIVSIVMASIYNVLHHSLVAYTHVETWAEVNQNARMAIERFSKEIRQIGRFLNIADVNRIRFGIDFNGDGDYTDDRERIQYRVSGGNLERRDRRAGNQAWRDWEAIANYVTGFVLTYRDEDNNDLSVPPALTAGERDAVRLVSVDIALAKQRKGGEDLHTTELRASMHPRNR